MNPLSAEHHSKRRPTLVRCWPFDQGSVVSSSRIILTWQAENNKVLAYAIYQFIRKHLQCLTHLVSDGLGNPLPLVNFEYVVFLSGFPLIALQKHRFTASKRHLIFYNLFRPLSKKIPQPSIKQILIRQCGARIIFLVGFDYLFRGNELTGTVFNSIV